MKEIFMVILMIINLVIIFLLNKYKKTKAGNIIGFCWLIVVMSIFFLFFSYNFNTTQNIFIAFLGGSGLIYFFYNFKKIVEDKTN